MMKVFVYETDTMTTACRRVDDAGHGIEIPDELVLRFEAALAAFEEVEQELATVAATENNIERLREKERLQIQLAARRKESLAKLKAMR